MEARMKIVTRRAFVFGTLAATAALIADKALPGAADDSATAAAGGIQKVSIVEFSNAGAKKGVVIADKVVKSDAEWKKLLSPQSYEITRHAGTEPPFHNKYDEWKEKGIYRCICCGTALFSSANKFDS